MGGVRSLGFRIQERWTADGGQWKERKGHQLEVANTLAILTG